MDEYKLLTSILSEAYICPSQSQMVETDNMGKIVQLASIDRAGTGVVEYKLYRFDSIENKSFLHFFKCSDDAPKSLRCFCDYILLTNHLGKLKVFLIELKSGTNSHVYKQLEASKCFFDYLKTTAHRIKDENECAEYSNENITVVKILVKRATTRPVTKISKCARPEYINDGRYYKYVTKTFDINYVCRCCTIEA